MKIAYLTASYPPVISGASRVVHGLSEGMLGRGHEVLVLTASDRGLPYSSGNPGLLVKRSRSFRNPMRKNHKFSLWPHASWIKGLKDFQPDVIHAHDPFQYTFSALAFRHSAGVPVVLTAHQLPWYVRNYLPASRMIRDDIEKVLWCYSGWVARQCDRLISPSAMVAEVVNMRFGMRAEVIPYGVDRRYFYTAESPVPDEAGLRASFGLPPDVPLVLHVGRLDVDKNVQVIIHAAAKVFKDNPGHLLVAGDGTQKASLQKLCAELGVGDRCHFSGFIGDQSRLADLYRLVDVFVTASEIETQGLVLYEAAACGLPLVAVRATCIPEIVRDGQTGLLAEPGDVAGLAGRVEYMLNNKGQARAMGRAAAGLANACTLERTVDLHEAVYADMLARRPGREM